MKRNLFSFISGLLIGVLLLGGSTVVAANGKSVTGMLRDITIFVNGQPVSVKAVNVNDTNYIKLRDVGEAVGFNVYWNGEVQVDTSTTYTGKAPAREEPAEPGAGLDANMDIRGEIIRRVNELRTANGLPALPTDERLMNAAQDISTKCFKAHDPYELEAVAAYGWEYGTGINQTMFTVNSFTDVALRAATNWQYSTPHFQTLLGADYTCLGVGVTLANDRAYCYLILGDPTSHSR